MATHKSAVLLSDCSCGTAKKARVREDGNTSHSRKDPEGSDRRGTCHPCSWHMYPTADCF